MAGRNKEDYLYEFASTGLGNNCRSVEDLEQRFYNWMCRNDYRLVSYGRDYRDNKFEKSVEYTMGIFEKDPHLASLFGLNGGSYGGNSYGGSYGGQWTPNNNTSGYGYGNSYGNSYGNGYGGGRKKTSSGSARSGAGRSRQNTRGYSNNRGYNNNDGYSLKGMFNFYKDKATGKGQGTSGVSPIGMLLIFAVVIVLIYKILGPAVYSFLTSGVPFKLICFAIGGFLSYKMLRSKNMGWPLPIKLIALFVIWVVLLNYDF